MGQIDHPANRRRVLFAIHSSVLGGAAQTMLTLCNAMTDRYDVGLLWSGARFDLKHEVLCRGPVFELELADYTKARPMHYARLLRRYHKIVRDFHPDIVVSRGFMPAKALGWPNRILGIASVAYLADSWPLTTLTRFMLRGNHIFAGVSRSTIEPIKVPRRRIVIPPGFSLNNVSPSSSKRAERIGKLRIGTVGELVPWKGHQHLIKAFSLLGDLRHQAELVIVGDDRLEPGYQAFLAELTHSLGIATSVQFAGFQHPVWPWYDKFDIFVLPTEANEAFGRVLVEAALKGLPLIGTRTGGIPEIIEDGTNGYLVPPGDSLALARAITRLAKDESLREKMGNRANVMARERYDIKVIVRRFEELFEALLNHDQKRLNALCF